MNLLCLGTKKPYLYFEFPQLAQVAEDIFLDNLNAQMKNLKNLAKTVLDTPRVRKIPALDIEMPHVIKVSGPSFTIKTELKKDKRYILPCCGKFSR